MSVDCKCLHHSGHNFYTYKLLETLDILLHAERTDIVSNDTYTMNPSLSNDYQHLADLPAYSYLVCIDHVSNLLYRLLMVLSDSIRGIRGICSLVLLSVSRMPSAEMEF